MIYRHRNTKICIINKASLQLHDSNQKTSDKPGGIQGKYNQVANFVYLQQEVNIKIGDRSPAEYMARVLQQCSEGEAFFGAITKLDDLQANLDLNCLPADIEAYQPENYEVFLEARRGKMTQKIKQYYAAL